MTNTDYVSAETAKLLKEIGYREFKSKTLTGEYNMVHLWDAQKWLRENYNIDICVNIEQFKSYVVNIYFDKELESWQNSYIFYESALDTGIACACEMIKNGKIKK